MFDSTPLISAVERLADRLRSLPQSALRRGAAAEGLALARELAVRAQRLEFPDAPPREIPQAGIFAVGDQLAVAGNDMALALRSAPSPEAELNEALALIAPAAHRIG